MNPLHTMRERALAQAKSTFSISEVQFHPQARLLCTECEPERLYPVPRVSSEVAGILQCPECSAALYLVSVVNRGQPDLLMLKWDAEQAERLLTYARLHPMVVINAMVKEARSR